MPRGTCKECGGTKNYNFVINNGLCDICISEKLENYEAELKEERKQKKCRKPHWKGCVSRETYEGHKKELNEQPKEKETFILEMVNKAADKSLDGYRELGQRAANAENERDQALSDNEALLNRTRILENVIKKHCPEQKIVKISRP